MASLGEDQAAGLRRLFAASDGATVVALAGPRQSDVVAALARGLAAAGKEVLVVDERSGAADVAAALGLATRHDLLQAVRAEVAAARVLLGAGPCLRLLPAGRAARQYARLDPATRDRLGTWLQRLRRAVDFVLVNAAEGAGDAALVARTERSLVTLAADAAALTHVYARIKRLAGGGVRRRFEVVLLGAPRPERAHAALANLQALAARRLGVELVLVAELTQEAEAQAGRLLADALLGMPPPRDDAPPARRDRTAALSMVV